MTLGSGLAIMGIWGAAAACVIYAGYATPIVIICAMVATATIAIEGGKE